MNWGLPNRKERRRAEAWHLLLAAIRAHPEEPMMVIRRCSGLRWGRLYVTLAELEKVGLITSRWAEGPKPRRRLYRLATFGEPRDPIE